MTTIIVSDAHLDVGPQGRKNMADFVAFLRRIDPATVNRLIILGDLFDFWFEYKHAIFSGYFDVLRTLAEVRDHGVELHFVCGNHDFWVGRFLRNELSFSIYPTVARLDFGGRRVLLLHGDGLNPKDWGYRLFKCIFRAKPVVWLFGMLHPDWAMAIARGVSRASRIFSRTSDPLNGSETAALRAFAKETLGRAEADVVITGHSHCPLQEEYPTPNGPGLYINTGDWLAHRSRVEWDGAEFRIVCEEVRSDPNA